MSVVGCVGFTLRKSCFQLKMATEVGSWDDLRRKGGQGLSSNRGDKQGQ